LTVEYYVAWLRPVSVVFKSLTVDQTGMH